VGRRRAARGRRAHRAGGIDWGRRMIREIVLDTETTGLEALRGDRLVEIGCVELLNHIPTGAHFHVYINPGRAVRPDAVAVHGLTDAFLADKPIFAAVAQEFLDFVRDDMLVIHNADFDTGFLNAELGRLGLPALDQERVLDTLALARRRNPGGKNSLDALCTRYGIDNSRRTKHGALLDAEILAEVYAELTGGRQTSLGLSREAMFARGSSASNGAGRARARPQPLASRLTDDERLAHAAFVATLGEAAVWKDYVRPA